jgi:Glycosyl transferase family 2
VKGRARRIAGDAFDHAQAREWLSGYRRGEVKWGAARSATSGLRMPRLRRRPGVGEVWAVATVRDELDVIEASITHLFDQGVDHVLVLDHRSSDGTRELLKKWSTLDARVHVVLDDAPGHFQSEKITRLSIAAWWAGAEWVVPFDADEFWYAENARLADFLRSSSASVVIAQMHDLVPVGNESLEFREREFLLDASPALDVKVAFRAHPLLRVGSGNHGVARVGPQSPGLHVAHTPYRGVAQVARKFQTGAQALDDSGAADWEGWHWRVGASLSSVELERVWDAIREGERVEQIGWTPSGNWVRGSILGAHTWQDDRELDRG